MADRLIIDEWLAKAENDFEFAQMVFSEEKEYYDQICFHFQQSSEKFLKAYIIANDLGFKGHTTCRYCCKNALKKTHRSKLSKTIAAIWPHFTSIRGIRWIGLWRPPKTRLSVPRMPPHEYVSSSALCYPPECV